MWYIDSMDKNNEALAKALRVISNAQECAPFIDYLQEQLNVVKIQLVAEIEVDKVRVLQGTARAYITILNSLGRRQ